jgi:ATP-dependent Clp endopeptidase proteolytic subunit ClpP
VPNKILALQKKDKKTNALKKVGSIEIRNQTETAAELCFYGDINSESLGEWQKYYPDDKAPKDVQDFLAQLDDVEEINVHINSGGGSVFGGIAIYNILKSHKAKINVYVDGIAASIASVIMCAGDKIYTPKNAMVMIHKPLSWCSGNADDMRKEADVLDQCQKVILNTYMQKVKEGVTEETMNELINAETWKNGEEWAEYFDIDVMDSKEIAACASDYFDNYKHLPNELNQQQQSNLVNIDDLADKVVTRVLAALKPKDPEDTPDDKEELEKQKAAILEDLDLI